MYKIFRYSYDEDPGETINRIADQLDNTDVVTGGFGRKEYSMGRGANRRGKKQFSASRRSANK